MIDKLLSRKRIAVVTDHGVMSSFVARLPHFVSVHMVPQMQGGGCAVVLPVLQAPANTADAVPCECLLKN